MPHPPFQNPIGLPFIELQSVDSTNNYALEQVYAGLARHGASFFAHEQVAGKGQRGKSWTAPKNSSLILSVVADPWPILLSQHFQVSACVAVSVHELFSRYAGDATSIKWPNDIYWHDRKAGGILIENIVGSKREAGSGKKTGNSRWNWAVIGTGININQESFPDGLQKAVSLKQITGREWNTIELAKELCNIFDRNLNILYQGGFEKIYSQYQVHLYKKEKQVRFRKGTRLFDATVKKVTPAGHLVVQHALEEEFTFGEIEWIIP